MIYQAPPKPLFLPRRYATAPQSLAVHYKTEICDVNSRGRITRVRPGQEGWNTITDWGMDALATLSQNQLIAYLHVGSTLGPAKRVLSGGVTLSLVITDATNIAVTASAGFFAAGDVGNTLSISDLGGAGVTQELKITAFTDAQHVTCATRQGAWLPGFVPGTGPFSTAGVHFTSVNTLNNQTTKFNTYDTNAANYNAELNDSGNSRSIHQRIFLSGVVGGSAWTINELGWSDGNVSNNVFGKVNLASPDVVAVGKKYRVTLQLFSGYTPVNILSQSVNWGATIGTYDLFIRQERVPKDSSGGGGTPYNFLKPFLPSNNPKTSWYTSAFAMQTTKWEGDAGYDLGPHGVGSGGDTYLADGAYTNGSHHRSRLATWSDAVAIANATALNVGTSDNLYGSVMLALKPNAGTISKPAGYWCALDFDIIWTRSFTN